MSEWEPVWFQAGDRAPVLLEQQTLFSVWVRAPARKFKQAAEIDEE